MQNAGPKQEVHLQIWSSVGAKEYSRVTEIVYTKTVREERIATVPVSMSIVAGDMVGFYVPEGELELHTVPDMGLTMYSTLGTTTSSISALGSVVGPSPYITVMFGE